MYPFEEEKSLSEKKVRRTRVEMGSKTKAVQRGPVVTAGGQPRGVY